MPTSVHEHKWDMRDWDKPEQMPKNGLFGVRLQSKWGSVPLVFVGCPNEFPVSEIDSFCSPTSYYRELVFSKKKNYLIFLSILDSFFEAKYTSTSVWLRTYFSLKYRLQTDSIRLFIKHSLHKQMLFSALRLHVHINISLIFTHLIWYSRTHVYAALHTRETLSTPSFVSRLSVTNKHLEGVWGVDTFALHTVAPCHNTKFLITQRHWLYL